MFDGTNERLHVVDWNVLTDRWLEVITLDALTKVCSPLKALSRASKIRCVALASPLDLFAAHRFLLTLLYWKADAAGGVKRLREALLRGELPQAVLEAIAAETPRFRLFDRQEPFLQDTGVQGTKDLKSVGSFFAEFASGSNIAHFHHGDDKNMRLCARCATIGMLRLVPWTQSGGKGLSPAVHNAPPIVAIAQGENLAVTLGLNLVPVSVEAGVAHWSGHFKPTDKDRLIPYLEALTWNPRRVHLRSPQAADVCWRCGARGIPVVGQIVYSKNAETKMRSGEKLSDKKPFEWNDPAAFYRADKAYTTVKSVDEADAKSGGDLAQLLMGVKAPKSLVVQANPEHRGWTVVIPCTNGKNNKTFDHRQVELTSVSPEAIRSKLPSALSQGPGGLDGWAKPQQPCRQDGSAAFIRAATQILAHRDWLAVSAAAYEDMHASPAAFDVMSGLWWGLRDKKVSRLPSRNVAWLVLKLMASVPASARVLRNNVSFNPLQRLPKRQPEELRDGAPAISPYPVSLPRGARLEAVLRDILGANMRRRQPEPVDWASLCYGLDRLLD